MRASLRWLLPSDEEFQSNPNGQHYYLARQGRRVVLQGGDVKAPLANSRINWVYDSHSSQSHHIAPRQTAPKIVPRRNHNKVPKDTGSTQHHQHSQAMPRNNVKNNNEDQANNSPQPPKRKRDRRHRRERRERERERVRERENRNEAFIHDARWASQRPGDPSSSSVPAQVTQSGPQDSDPISAMRPAVYQPPESVGNSSTNDNSPFQIGLESCEFPGLLPGLYKPADPDPQHDTWAFSPAAYSSEKGPPSPTRTPAAHSSDSRTRTGIVYPLQPRSRRPDVCIQVEASLPEPAALLRPDLRQPSREAPTSLPRTHKRLSRKRRRNRSTALYRPAKRSPPRGHWCDV